MYEVGPNEKELAAFGMTLDDVATGPTEVWPESTEAFYLFSFMRTQWRTAMNGPTGLDYGVLFRKMDRMHLTEEEYLELECQVRIMEDAALQCIHARE